MAKYLVETNHSPRECRWALEHPEQAEEMMTHFEWGCADGVHSGWAIVEAEHKFAVQALVPRIFRPSTRIIELSQFTVAEARAYHAGELAIVRAS